MDKISASQCTGKLQPVGDALYVIGGKWKLKIIIALSEGHDRFNAIQKVVDGISAKVLSNELKDLELNSFVTRRVVSEAPLIVLYEPTVYLHSLSPVLHALATWGTMHREKLRSEH